MRVTLLTFLCLFLISCKTTKPYDYTLYRELMPRTLLVIPPTNNSNDVKATYGYYSTLSKPLAELGYYVYPLGVVDSFFKENGISMAAEMKAVPLDKLSEIFGADAVIYIDLIDYGSKYMGIVQATVVNANITLVDCASGKVLWKGSIYASDSSDGSDAGLVGMLVTAAVKQIVEQSVDYAHLLSERANNQLLGGYNMLLEGPLK
jgi:hypothetical protein